MEILYAELIRAITASRFWDANRPQPAGFFVCMSEKLTQKQEAFCQRYIETGNASEAYRLSYDAENMSDEAVRVEAHRLQQNPNVSLRLDQLRDFQLKRHQVTADRVIAEYSRLAFLDIRKAFDEEGRLKPIHELDDDTAAAISGLEVEQLTQPVEVDEELEGQPHGGSLRRARGKVPGGRLVKIKLSDKKGALDSLAKTLGIAPDKLIVVHQPLPEQDKALLNDYVGKEAD